MGRQLGTAGKVEVVLVVAPGPQVVVQGVHGGHHGVGLVVDEVLHIVGLHRVAAVHQHHILVLGPLLGEPGGQIGQAAGGVLLIQSEVPGDEPAVEIAGGQQTDLLGVGIEGLHLGELEQHLGQLRPDGGAVGVQQAARFAGQHPHRQTPLQPVGRPAGHVGIVRGGGQVGDVLGGGEQGHLLAVAVEDGCQLTPGDEPVAVKVLALGHGGQTGVLGPASCVGVPGARRVGKAGGGSGGSTRHAVEGLEYNSTGYRAVRLKISVHGGHNAFFHHIVLCFCVPGEGFRLGGQGGDGEGQQQSGRCQDAHGAFHVCVPPSFTGG